MSNPAEILSAETTATPDIVMAHTRLGNILAVDVGDMPKDQEEAFVRQQMAEWGAANAVTLPVRSADELAQICHHIANLQVTSAPELRVLHYDLAGNPIAPQNPEWRRTEVMRTASGQPALRDSESFGGSDEEWLKESANTHAVLSIIAAWCQILDLQKKKIFYGQTLSQEKKDAAHADLAAAQQLLSMESADVHRVLGVAPLREADMSRTHFVHGMIGCLTESAELWEAYGEGRGEVPQMNQENLVGETGDLSWYFELVLESITAGTDKPRILNTAAFAHNVRKLRVRYPVDGGYSNDRAVARVDKQTVAGA